MNTNEELKTLIKTQADLHEEIMHPESEGDEEIIQFDAAQKAYDNVLKGTKQLAEIEAKEKELELKEKELEQKKEEEKKSRKVRTVMDVVKIGAELATTAAVMLFTASENKKSRIFETSADYMSTVSRSTNKLIQDISSGLKNVFRFRH